MKIILRTFIVLMILIFAMIAFIMTPTGLKVTADIATKIVPGKLSYRRISGVILGPINIEDLKYENQQQKIRIKYLSVNWRLSDLLRKKVTITHFIANDINVYLAEQKAAPKKPITRQSIQDAINAVKNTKVPHLPVDIELKRAQLKNITIALPSSDKKIYQINQVNLSLLLEKDRQKTDFYLALPSTYPIHTVSFNYDNQHGNRVSKVNILGQKTNWRGVGKGDVNHFEFKTLKSQLLGGQLKASFHHSKKRVTDWQFDINAQQLDLSLINPLFPNQLSLRVNTKGHKHGALSKLALTIPGGELKVDAKFHDRWALSWKAHVKDLSKLDENFTGRLDSSGSLNTTINHVRSNGYVKIKKLSIAEIDAGAVDLNWIVRLNDRPKVDATLIGKQISLGEETIQFVKVVTSGDVNRHHISAEVHSNEKRLNLSLLLNNDKAGLSALIKKLKLSAKNKTIIALKNPSKIIYHDNHLKIPRTCFSGAAAMHLCIYSDDTNKNPWRLFIKGHIPLKLFSEFVSPEVAEISRGQLNIDASFQAKDGAPALSGNVQLTQGHINFPTLNLSLKDFAIKVTGSENKLNFLLKAMSKGRPIVVDGSVDLSKRPLLTTINIKTDNTLIMDTEQYVIYATTDLTVKITGNKVLVTGDIVVPSAKISPHDFHSTTSLPTSDITFIGKKTKKASIWQVTTEINIKLGKSVKIDVAGVTARVDGGLKITGDTNKETLATGQLNIHDGKYSIYGNTLTIGSGSYISYSNNLLSNPYLNIKASKEVATVANAQGTSLVADNKLTVGVELTDTVKNPRLTFFSSPITLSQADILSYLVLGYASGSNTPGNTDLLLRALSALDVTSMGLGGKENIATQIQQGLGLSEMGLESDNTVDALGTTINRSSSFVVGKHLTKKLYLRYSIGVLNTSVNVFELRYLINENWAIQTDSSSQGSGADVLYTIEKD